MADKDLDELITGLKKAAVGTAALTVAQLAVKKVTDQLAATVGAFDKQVAKATNDVEALTTGVGAFGGEAAKAATNVKSMADAFDGLLKTLTPLSAVLQDVGDRLEGAAISIHQSSVAINVHNQALTQLQSVSVAAASGQDAVSEAIGKTEAAADKGAEKLKKVQETAGELGSSMIDAFTALASGEEPMKVLTDKGGEMAKTMLKAKLDGVNLVETFKTLGVATGLLKVTTAEAAAAQVVGAAAFDAAAVSAQGATVATGELAAVESVALAPLGVALAAIAVIAGGVAGAFAIAAHDISGNVGDLTKDMGLTEEQMGRVKDKSVTMGDVAKATFEALGERLTAVFGPALKVIGDTFMGIYHTVTDIVLKTVATAVGAFAGAFEAIRVSWSMLPAAMGDIIISGVNFVLDGVGQMINGAIGLANGLIGTVNGLAKQLGFSLELPDLGQVHVAKLANQFAGAAKAAGGAISSAFEKGFNGGFKGVMNIPAEIAGRAVEIAKHRIEEEAGEISASAGGTACSCPKTQDGAARKSAEVKPAESFAQYEDLVRQRMEEVELTRMPEVDLTEYNKQQEALQQILDAYTKINDLAPKLGQSFENAFGKSGKALSAFVGSWSSLGKQMTEIRQKESVGLIDTQKAEKQRAEATIEGYAQMAGAAKGFFDKKSSGYAALQAIEQAYRLWQFAMNVKEMAQEATKTTTGIANSLARGAASAAAGAGKIFETMGPFGFPVVAAMLALLAGLGLKGGGGGGGSIPGANDMKTRQDTQGSGSVLGDSKAKSESLEKALTHSQAYENKDLEYGNAMVRALQSIDNQIGVVASALARSFAAGGMLSTEDLNLGKSGTAPTLKNLGFGKTTTRTLQDQGIQFGAASLGDVLDGGLSGSTYQQVLETTKKKAFGFTTSNKSKVITETGALDGDFLGEITRLVGFLNKGVTEAAKALGSTDFEAALAGFKVDLGKLSFKDMTGTQIEEALNAVFGKLGDDIAKAAVPTIAQFQKVGEGAFETLVRVARQYEVIDTTLESIGMKFGDVGISSLAARERLVELVGGLDNFTEQAGFFAEHFLSEEERLKPVRESVTNELARLKLPTDLTREGFKDKVTHLDVSKAGDAELYTALMALAPAFDKVASAAENAREKVESANEKIKEQRSSIQGRIDELTKSPEDLLAAKRAAERAAAVALDESLGTLLDTLYGLENAADVAAKQQTNKGLMRQLNAMDDAVLGTTSARDAARDDELAKLDPLGKALQKIIWAREDEAKVLAIRQSVQDRMDALTMSSAELLAKSRAAERAELLKTDAAIGPWLDQLYALEDAAKARTKADELQAEMDKVTLTEAELLAKSRAKERAELFAINPALAELADKLYKAQDAAAAHTAAIAHMNAVTEKARSIQDRIDDIVLTPAQKLAKAREIETKEVMELDAALLPLLKTLYDTEDAAKAAVDAEEARSKAAELQANRQAKLAELLEAQGQTQAAKLLRRAQELAAITDPVQRALQQQIYVAQDAAEKISKARDVLSAAYQKESAAIQATSDKMKDLGKTLRDYSASLGKSAVATLDPALQRAVTEREFTNAANQARLGDMKAAELLPSLGEAFRAASEASATDQIAYLRDLAVIREATDAAAATAERQKAIADDQLKALRLQVENLIDLDDSVVSVKDALVEMQTALAAGQADQTLVQVEALNKQLASLWDLNQLIAAVDTSVKSTGATTTQALVDLATSQVKVLGEQYILLQLINNSVLLVNTATLGVQASIGALKGDFGGLGAQISQLGTKIVEAASKPASGTKGNLTGDQLYYKNEIENDTISARVLRESDPALYKQLVDYANGVTNVRPQFAAGGVFTNGVVSQPTTFDMGLMGEAGPEAIVPLVRGPQGLGVRMSGGSGDNADLIAALKASIEDLKSEVSALRSDASRTARASEKTANTLVRVSRDGDALITQAA